MTEDYRRARKIQAPPNAPAQVRQAGPRAVQVLLVVLAAICLVIPGIGYSTVGTLDNNLSTAKNLGLGERQDGAVDILLVGTDSRVDAQGQPLNPEEIAMLRAGDEVALNTDTMILIRIPSDGSSATAVSLPRDTYVHTNALGNTKLNGVYGQTKFEKEQQLAERGKTDPKEIDKESTEAARQALIKAVAGLTGITVDHYAEVGLFGFVLLTDAIGGVPVCLNNAVNEPLSGANFPAGRQTLNGPDALSFVRQRHDLPRGDLDRITRQQAYMAALVSKVLSTGTLTDPSKLNRLSKAVERSVVLDSDWDIVGFATQLQNLAGGNVRFETIPVTSIDGTGDNGESIVTVNLDQVHQFFNALGTKQGKADKDAKERESAQHFQASKYSVQVLNASDETGLAGQVTDVVAAMGYGTKEAENTDSAPKSVVKVANTDDPAARSLAAALGELPLEVDASLAEGDIVVQLGADYKGPTEAPAGLGTPQVDPENPLYDNDSTEPSDENTVGEVGSRDPNINQQTPITASGGPKCVN